MKELLTAVARQLTLSEPPKPANAVAAAATDAAGKVQSAATAAVTSKSSTLSSLLTGQSGGGAPPLPPGHEIDERYRQLRELVAATGGAPIDQVLKLLNDLQQQLAKLAAALSAVLPLPALPWAIRRWRCGPKRNASHRRWRAGFRR